VFENLPAGSACGGQRGGLAPQSGAAGADASRGGAEASLGAARGTRAKGRVGMFFRVAAYMPKWCTIPDGTRVIREFEQCVLDVLQPWASWWRAR
jgi:hypothetical protein